MQASWAKLVLLECALRPPPPPCRPAALEEQRSDSAASGLRELAGVREMAESVARQQPAIDPVEHTHLTLLALLSGYYWTVLRLQRGPALLMPTPPSLSMLYCSCVSVCVCVCVQKCGGECDAGRGAAESPAVRVRRAPERSREVPYGPIQNNVILKVSN